MAKRENASQDNKKMAKLQAKNKKHKKVGSNKSFSNAWKFNVHDASDTWTKELNIFTTYTRVN